ncbi:hypothetical protein Agub_g3464, partial [Astrephomene gubernaculifera]
RESCRVSFVSLRYECASVNGQVRKDGDSSRTCTGSSTVLGYSVRNEAKSLICSPPGWSSRPSMPQRLRTNPWHFTQAEALRARSYGNDAASLELKVLDLAKLVRTAQDCQQQSDLLHGLQVQQLGAGLQTLRSQVLQLQSAVFEASPDPSRNDTCSWQSPNTVSAAATATITTAVPAAGSATVPAATAASAASSSTCHACGSRLTLTSTSGGGSCRSDDTFTKAVSSDEGQPQPQLGLARRSELRALMARVETLEGAVQRSCEATRRVEEARDKRLLALEAALAASSADRDVTSSTQRWDQQQRDQDVRQLREMCAELGARVGGMAAWLGVDDAGWERREGGSECMLGGTAAVSGEAATTCGGITPWQGSDAWSEGAAALPPRLHAAVQRCAEAAAAAAWGAWETRMTSWHEAESSRLQTLAGAVRSLSLAHQALTSPLERLALLCPRLLATLEALQRCGAAADATATDSTGRHRPMSHEAAAASAQQQQQQQRLQPVQEACTLAKEAGDLLAGLTKALAEALAPEEQQSFASAARYASSLDSLSQSLLPQQSVPSSTTARAAGKPPQQPRPHQPPPQQQQPHRNNNSNSHQQQLRPGASSDPTNADMAIPLANLRDAHTNSSSSPLRASRQLMAQPQSPKPHAAAAPMQPVGSPQPQQPQPQPGMRLGAMQQHHQLQHDRIQADKHVMRVPGPRSCMPGVGPVPPGATGGTAPSREPASIPTISLADLSTPFLRAGAAAMATAGAAAPAAGGAVWQQAAGTSDVSRPMPLHETSTAASATASSLAGGGKHGFAVDAATINDPWVTAASGAVQPPDLRAQLTAHVDQALRGIASSASLLHAGVASVSASASAYSAQFAAGLMGAGEQRSAGSFATSDAAAAGVDPAALHDMAAASYRGLSGEEKRSEGNGDEDWEADGWLSEPDGLGDGYPARVAARRNAGKSNGSFTSSTGARRKDVRGGRGSASMVADDVAASRKRSSASRQAPSSPPYPRGGGGCTVTRGSLRVTASSYGSTGSGSALHGVIPLRASFSCPGEAPSARRRSSMTRSLELLQQHQQQLPRSLSEKGLYGSTNSSIKPQQPAQQRAFGAGPGRSSEAPSSARTTSTRRAAGAADPRDGRAASARSLSYGSTGAEGAGRSSGSAGARLRSAVGGLQGRGSEGMGGEVGRSVRFSTYQAVIY